MKKVAIVGFASSSRGLAPFNDENFEIWTMNHAPISWIQKWNVLFEMHSMEHLSSIYAHATDASHYLKWLRELPGPGDPKYAPVYMRQHFPEIPASVPLPREEMNKWLKSKNASPGCFADDYWTSTISYMIGLALLQGREEICLYGVDLLQDDEYFYQRAGAEYLIGFARGLGIKVYIPEQSALCKSGYVYGFTEEPKGLTSASGLGLFIGELKHALEDGGDIMEVVRKKIAEVEGTIPDSVTSLVEYVKSKIPIAEEGVLRAKQDANTFHGALQMADLVREWLLKEDDVTKNLAEKRAEIEKKFETARTASCVSQGQVEAFQTVVTWGKHIVRGGVLKS